MHQILLKMETAPSIIIKFGMNNSLIQEAYVLKMSMIIFKIYLTIQSLLLFFTNYRSKQQNCQKSKDMLHYLQIFQTHNCFHFPTH